MTEYKIHNNTPLTEISDWPTRNVYFEQAKEEYLKGNAYEMTFLPIAEGFRDFSSLYIANDSWGHRRDPQEAQAYTFIMRKTLEKTFEQGNFAHNSMLIANIAGNHNQGKEPEEDAAYHLLTARAIYRQINKDKTWFGKLAPVAQLAAIGMEPQLRYEDGVNLDFSQTPSEYDYNLGGAANLVLKKAYRRDDYNGRVVVKPLENQPFSWEIKAAALEAQLKGRSSDNRIPSAPVFADLMATAESTAQLNKLSELTKNPELKNALDYGLGTAIFQAFEKVPPRGEATQALFYNIMHNLNIKPHQVSLPRDSINYETLEAAKGECEAQRIVDTLKKQKQIDAIDNFDLVAKYRPEFLEQTAKMSPAMCGHILNKRGDRLSVQTQIEMMTKVVKSFDLNLTGATYKENTNALNRYIERAIKLNTSSKAMKKFIDALQPHIETAKMQYDADKKYLADAAKAKEELAIAKREVALFDKSRTQYQEISTIITERVKQTRQKAKAQEPSDEVLDKFMADGIAGKKTNLSFEPKSGIGKLFMSKAEKDGQADLLELVQSLNNKMADFAKTEEFKYAPEVACSYDEYWHKRQEKQKIQDEKQKIVDNNWYNLTNSEELRVNIFEQAGIAEKFAKLQEQFKERSDQMRGRARSDLSMQFGRQDFNGKKPIPGLVEEEKMAQDIYKAKITELRQSIKDGVKQDMTEREVNKTPRLDEPNKVGKPMTKESTKKIRKQMKDLKTYRKLVRE